jgi:NADH-quinone oxidoreductase subunit L
VWLPDAMAGPTPVSALIHAATMVTAGVYMLCRLNFLYILAPSAMAVVALVGALTALLAATIALSQYDIKKVLAYSTVSQLGYMVMAAGIGAYSAAFFHVMTHAFFKALLFLGAGSIIHALHHEQDMRKMGGLRKYMPVTFWTFTAAYLAIIGFPGFSGFFSKDEILWLSFSTPASQLPLFGSLPLPPLLWALGFVTAALTAFYMSRLYFMTFFGEYRGLPQVAEDVDEDAPTDPIGVVQPGHGSHLPHESPWLITLPLVVLAILSVVSGLFNLPHWLPGAGKLHHFLEPTFHAAEHALAPAAQGGMEFPLMGVTLLVIACSVGLAWRIYGQKGQLRIEGSTIGLPGWAVRASANKWYVDEIYETLVIRPIHFLSRSVLWAVVDVLIIDGLVNGVAAAARKIGETYSRVVHVGQVQAYALAITLGSLVLVFLFAFGGPS